MSKEILEQMEHDYKNAFPIEVEWLLKYTKEQTEQNKQYRAMLEGIQRIDEDISIDYGGFEIEVMRLVNEALENK